MENLAVKMNVAQILKVLDLINSAIFRFNENIKVGIAVGSLKQITDCSV